MDKTSGEAKCPRSVNPLTLPFSKSLLFLNCISQHLSSFFPPNRSRFRHPGSSPKITASLSAFQASHHALRLGQDLLRSQGSCQIGEDQCRTADRSSCTTWHFLADPWAQRHGPETCKRRRMQVGLKCLGLLPFFSAHFLLRTPHSFSFVSTPFSPVHRIALLIKELAPDAAKEPQALKLQSGHACDHARHTIGAHRTFRGGVGRR